MTRMTNPAFAVPGAMPALAALGKAVAATGLPPLTAELAHIRASQINGCGTCLVQHQRLAAELGAEPDTLYAVAAWRDAPYFDEQERIALELAEELSRLADRGEAVSDDLWRRASASFDEPQLAALLLTIASVNLWNRLNAATHQPAGLRW